MNKVYVYKLHPTKPQEAALMEQMETLRRLYNRALAEHLAVEEQIRAAGLKACEVLTKTDAEGKPYTLENWKWVSEEAKQQAKPFYAPLALNEQKKRLITQGRATDTYLANANVGTCQQTLMRLDKAFKRFFDRVKKGETPGYPKFKKRRDFATIAYNSLGNGCRLDGNRVYLQHIGMVKIHLYRDIEEGWSAKNISITRKADGWWLNILVGSDQEPAIAPRTDACVTGLDFGLGKFITAADGSCWGATGFYQRDLARLAAKQKAMDTKHQRGSCRWRELGRQAARLSQDIARRRKEWYILVANNLCEHYGTIYYEKLDLRAMMRRPEAKEDSENPGTFLPSGAEATLPRRRALYDAAWGEFVEILKRQAAARGVCLLEVEAAYTTQDCSACHQRSPVKIKLTDTEFVCRHCSARLDRKLNAARNVLRRGVEMETEPMCEARTGPAATQSESLRQRESLRTL